MEAHSIQVLEFGKVRAILRRYVASTPGGAEVDDLVPRDAPDDVRRLLAETREIQRLLERGIAMPLAGVSDVLPLLEKTTPTGTLLESRELNEVKSNIHTSIRIIEFFEKHNKDVGLLAEVAQTLHPFPELEEVIERTVNPEGMVRDGASPSLGKLRKRSREVRKELTERLERIIRRGDVRPLLQDPIITIRGGRYVIPVLVKFHNKIKGIVHDRSGTGTTVYMEPLETVHLGNRLRELEAEEKVEVQRVLREITARLRRHYGELRDNQRILARLDLTSAKARFAIEFRCCIPQMTTEGSIRLRGGRHPLLVEVLGSEVVPTDFHLPPGKRGLVITGPNTGGKTVLLKLIGLTALMAHAGLPVPCDEADIPCCSQILADIGDEQSIEQSLSTFSSHVSRIKQILGVSDERTLVLLDELGAGTDPVEGSALAVAVLRAICAKVGAVIVTTHLAELKVVAYESPEMENAAMLFDERTLSPTYGLTIGLAGRSNALAIARRLGLPGPILAEAEEALAQKEAQPEHLLARLHADVAEADQRRQSVQRELDKAEQLRRERSLALQRAERQREDVLQRARQSSQGIVRELELRVDEMKRRLRGLRQHAEHIQNRLDQGLREAVGDELGAMERAMNDLALEAEQEAQRESVPESAPPEYDVTPLDLNSLAIGDKVEIHGFSQLGEVMAIQAGKGELRVAIGMMELVVRADRVVGVAQPATKEAGQTATGNVRYAAKAGPPLSLDLIGKTVEQMTPELERYLEQAYVAEYPRVTIIHGYGSGALRRGVRAWLADCPMVAGMQDGSHEDGGKAVTVAVLKQ